jgi:predicted nucleic acid-binding Zn finger protein
MKQLVSRQTKFVNEESRILRECRGRRLALLGSVCGLQNSKFSFYVKSEFNDRYYFVEYKQNWNFCTCWDYASNRSDKCKHIFAVEYALRLNLVQQIDHKLPICQFKKVAASMSSNDVIDNKPKSSIADQYKGYSIATLNELEKAEIEAEQYKRVQRWEDDSYDF